MRRISKREINFRFDLIDRVKVTIDHFEHGYAVAKVAGVNCHLETTRAERRDIRRPGRVVAYVESFPARRGDGTLAKGFRSETNELDGFLAGRAGRSVVLNSVARTSEMVTFKYEDFAQKYPVGTLIEARVIAVYKDKIRMQLAEGVYSTMPINSYVDRLPNWRRMDLPRFPVPEQLEVIVRSVRPSLHSVTVSLHAYQRDLKYCVSASGYRHSFDAKSSQFQHLPWERDRA